MISDSVMLLAAVLMIAALVAMITRRLNFPYTAGLVIAGVVFALIPNTPSLPLSKDLIYSLFLPPLLFETAFAIRWAPFRRDLALTLSLASLGVVITAFVIGVGMHYLAGWSWIGALLFGALISATDPVSVVAMFKEITVPARLQDTVETESLLNDGTASVLFTVLLLYAAGADPGPIEISGILVVTVFGGLILGAVIGYLALLFIGRTRDQLVEVTLTMIAAYTAFLIADHFDMSGPLATVAAGIVMGNAAPDKTFADKDRTQILMFWAFAGFMANSFIFFLIGDNEALQSFGLAVGVIAIAYPLTLVARAVSVYPICAVFAGSKLAVPLSYQHVLVWAGLRGAVALALALSLPETVPERGTIIIVTFAVVGLSIFVQGLTMAPLIRSLGLIIIKDRQGERLTRAQS